LGDSTFLGDEQQQKISEMLHMTLKSNLRAFDLLLCLFWICVTQANACTNVRQERGKLKDCFFMQD